MNIESKIKQIKRGVALTAIGLVLTLGSGCAYQTNDGFEFSLLNGRYGHRKQTKWGKGALNPEQDLFNSQAQVQPYATQSFSQHPPGMMEAYKKKDQQE